MTFYLFVWLLGLGQGAPAAATALCRIVDRKMMIAKEMSEESIMNLN